MGTLRVLDPGLLTTIQDASGRPGLGRFGIPPGGATDAGAAEMANRLVGNAPGEAVLEMALVGPYLAITSAAHIAITGGDLDAVGEHHRLVPGHSYPLRAGSTVRFGAARRGARGYLAVAGGFIVPRVLGSASTDRRSGFGGLDGRPLRAGDVLTFGAAGPATPRRSVDPGTGGRLDDAAGDGVPRIRVVPVDLGLGWFEAAAVEALIDTDWSVAPDADRSGIRLQGGRIPGATTSIASLGVPVGAIQVPPSGEPIITMVDGPVTGGYPVIGVVAAADHGRLAQLAAADAVRFEAVTVAQARAIVPSVTTIEIDPGDVGAGWAG